MADGRMAILGAGEAGPDTAGLDIGGLVAGSSRETS